MSGPAMSSTHDTPVPRNRRNLTIVTLALLFVFASVAALAHEPTPSSEVGVAEPDQGGALQTADESLRADAAKLAADLGTDIDSGVSAILFQQRYAEFMERAEQQGMTEQFAGASINLQDRTGTVYFAGVAPPEFAASAASEGLAVHVVDGMALTLGELRTQQQLVTDGLIDAGFTNVTAGLDIETQIIEITVGEPTESSESAIESKRIQVHRIATAALTRANVSTVATLLVDVVLTDAPLSTITPTGGG